MKNIPISLRCYARPEDDSMIAICIDLDIAVKGDTITEVKLKMKDAIKVYLDSLTPDDYGVLLPRRSPLHVMADYYRVAVWVLLLKLVHSAKRNFQIFCESITPRDFVVSSCGA